MLAFGLFLVVSEDTYLPVEEEDGEIMGAVMRSRQLVSVWLLPRLRGKTATGTTGALASSHIQH
jgi:hypothetical protein